jgi:predicted permease
MNAFLSVAPAVATVFGTIVLAVLLRRTGFPNTDHAPIFSRLILDVALPALIFVNLAEGTTRADMMGAPLLILAAEIGVLVLAWVVGRAMKLERPALGSFLLASTFGSSAVIGYTLARQLYPGDAEALLEATIITELGVGVGVFTLGVLVATHFGTGGSPRDAIVSFVRSRVFIAVAAGLLWSVAGLPTKAVPLKVVFDVLRLFGEGLPILAALVVGLMLKPVPVRRLLPLVVACVALKLAVEPGLVALAAHGAHAPKIERDLLILMAGMPSGTVAAVLASRHGCDAPLASALVVATTIAGALSVALVFSALG